MKTTEERIKRLEFWNRVLLALLVLFAIGAVGKLFLQKSLTSLQSLSIYQKPDGEIRFHSISDGPRVVTHLVMFGNSEGAKRTAVLPQPLAIIDSSGAGLTADEVKKLSWINIYGEPIAPPAIGSKIQALYFFPVVASTSKSE